MTCPGPSQPAEELEEVIAESLLECYRDNALFDDAIARHLARQADKREPLEEELTSVTGTIADKERTLRRYCPGQRAAGPTRGACCRPPGGRVRAMVRAPVEG